MTAALLNITAWSWAPLLLVGIVLVRMAIRHATFLLGLRLVLRNTPEAQRMKAIDAYARCVAAQHRPRRTSIRSGNG